MTKFARVIVAILLGFTLFAAVFLFSRINSTIVSQQPSALPTPSQVRVTDLVIQGDEVPQGWRLAGIQVHSVPGAQERFVWFYNTFARNISWVNFSEEPIVYQTPDEAARAYAGWISEVFPSGLISDLKQIPELTFNSHADQIQTACFSLTLSDIPAHSCSTVARYQNVIVIILGNVFEDRWLTMADFRSLLETIDQHVVLLDFVHLS